ncbi:MAG: hypothetical protein GF414_08565 [Candidatus Altiarchaeales archaeon]|nr:hypothetical protein [Candidatus Altiarchaeales archaeon]
MKRRMKTGDEIWKQIYSEQHGEDRDIEHHRGLIELIKNSRDAYLDTAGRIRRERCIAFEVDGNTIRCSNDGYDWVSINDFEIIGRDSHFDKGSRHDMEDSMSGKEVGRLQIFRLARLLPDGSRDFKVRFHCKDVDGDEESVRIHSWNEQDGTYEVDILDERVSGTHWEIRCDRPIDDLEMEEYLEEQLRFFDTDIEYTFNDRSRTHRAPSKSERKRAVRCRKNLALPDGLGNAYINHWGNGDFKVYNLGVKLRTTLDVEVSGISGVIITDKFLPEDLGRGSLMQSDEDVETVVAEVRCYGIDHLTKKLKHKSGSDLTGPEREFLLKRARWDSPLRRQIETKRLIPRGNGSYTSISSIVQRVKEGKEMFWATGDLATDDKAISRGMNVVELTSATMDILSKYGIEEPRLLEELETVQQWKGGYRLLPTSERVEQFFEVLKEWLVIAMRRGIDSQETPVLRVGRVENQEDDTISIEGWTNSMDYIAFNKSIIEKDAKTYFSLDGDLLRLEFLRHSATMEVLTHETAHWALGDDSVKISTHGENFDTALLKVRWAVFQEMDQRIKESLSEPKLAEWTSKVKYRTGGDGRLIFSVAIPREHTEKLDLGKDSLVHIVIRTAKEIDENYTTRGYSHG